MMDSPHGYLIDGTQIFTLLFIMLGPLRMISSFILATRELATKDKNKLAVKVFVISTVTLILGGLIGAKLLSTWRVQPNVLMIAGGIIFFLVALKPLIQTEDSHKSLNIKPIPAEIVFNIIISPYGMAAVIVLLSVSHDLHRTLVVLSCLTGVMLCDLMVMLLAKSKRSDTQSIPARILGAALGTLQLALALQFIIEGYKAIH